jgi:hypothetical protein
MRKDRPLANFRGQVGCGSPTKSKIDIPETNDLDCRARDSSWYLLLCAGLFHAPGKREKFLKIWPFILLLEAVNDFS